MSPPSGYPELLRDGAAGRGTSAWNPRVSTDGVVSGAIPESKVSETGGGTPETGAKSPGTGARKMRTGSKGTGTSTAELQVSAAVPGTKIGAAQLQMSASVLGTGSTISGTGAMKAGTSYALATRTMVIQSGGVARGSDVTTVEAPSQASLLILMPSLFLALRKV